MSNYIALSPKQHQSYGWQPYSNYYHAATQAVAPITMGELNQIITCMPMAFIPRQTQDNASRFELVALQSLKPGHNVYVDQTGIWLAPYIPAQYRSYPFAMIQHPQQPENSVLCFEQDSPNIHTIQLDNDTPFFSTNGQLSPQAQRNFTIPHRARTKPNTHPNSR